MKIVVKEVFVDKFDNTVVYEAGSVIDLADTARCKDIIDRGLAVAVEGEPKKPLLKTKAKKEVK